MTTEEKAKAYDEALTKAKIHINCKGIGDTVNLCTHLFPELRESEDERILESIADCISLMGEDGGVFSNHNVTKEDVLNWLEKQKINTEGDFARGYDCGYEACLNSHGAEWFEKQKEPSAWESPIMTHEMIMEKKKENPKSADSIPSDCISDAKCKDRWHKVSDSLPDNPREVLCKDEAGNYFIGRYYVGEGWDISNYDDEDKPHHLNPPVSKWIDFPSENQKEQKPAEWSEEDKTCLEYALWCVMKTRHFVAKDACDLDACRCAERWLEFLPERFNLQPKQEWRKEDNNG